MLLSRRKYLYIFDVLALASMYDLGDNENTSVCTSHGIDIEIIEINSPVVEGDDIIIRFDCSHVIKDLDSPLIPPTGITEEPPDLEVEVMIDVAHIGQFIRTVSVPYDSSREHSVSIPTVEGDIGIHTVTVETDREILIKTDDNYTVTGCKYEDSLNVTIISSHEFIPEITDVVDSGENDRMFVTVRVENTGEAGGHEVLNVNSPSLGSDSTNISLSGKDTTTATLSINSPSSNGKYDIYTSVGKNVDKRQIRVQDPNKDQLATEDINLEASLTVSKNEVELGEITQVILSTINVVSSEAVTLQLVLQPPSGVNIVGSYGVEEGSSQVTSTTDIQPGEEANIRISIQVDEPGSHDIDGLVIVSTKKSESELSLSSTTIEAVNNIQRESGDNETDDSTGDGSTGFGIGSGLTAMAGVGYALRNRLTNDGD